VLHGQRNQEGEAEACQATEGILMELSYRFCQTCGHDAVVHANGGVNGCAGLERDDSPCQCQKFVPYPEDVPARRH
jgi:hypothetical protein